MISTLTVFASMVFSATNYSIVLLCCYLLIIFVWGYNRIYNNIEALPLVVLSCDALPRDSSSFKEINFMALLCSVLTVDHVASYPNSG